MAVTASERSLLLRSILAETTRTRDALPYTDEFDRHYSAYTKVVTDATRQQFWRSLSSVAKGGGVRGKPAGEAAPAMTHQVADELRRLLAGRLGTRDSLPYSAEFDAALEPFNKAAGVRWTQHKLWLAVCQLAKRPPRREIERLIEQSLASLTAGVDRFNSTPEAGRPAAVVMHLDHACELLLKAGLIQRGCDIRDASGHTWSFEQCVNKATDDGGVKFLTPDQRRAFRGLNGLRDQAQHYLLIVDEPVLLMTAQTAVRIYADLTARLFAVSLADRLPRRVLPLSLDPPRSAQVLMDHQFSQLKALLSGRKTEARYAADARLRTLLALDRAVNDQPTAVPSADMAAAGQSVRTATVWTDVFPGLAKLEFSADGSGAGVAVTIQKAGGVPVHVVKDDTAAGVLTLRAVKDTEQFCYGAKDLAGKLKLNQNAVVALIWKLELQADDTCYRLMTIGRSEYKRYSPEALKRLQESVPDLDVASVSREYQARPRAKR